MTIPNQCIICTLQKACATRLIWQQYRNHCAVFEPPKPRLPVQGPRSIADFFAELLFHGARSDAGFVDALLSFFFFVRSSLMLFLKSNSASSPKLCVSFVSLGSLRWPSNPRSSTLSCPKSNAGTADCDRFLYLPARAAFARSAAAPVQTTAC